MIHYPQQPARAPRAQCLPPSSPGLAREPRAPCAGAAPTCVHPVVGLQLVLQAELLAAAVALVGLLPGVDALVALQGALVPKAAAAELALVGVVACKHTHISPPTPHWGAVWGSPKPQGPPVQILTRTPRALPAAAPQPRLFLTPSRSGG